MKKLIAFVMMIVVVITGCNTKSDTQIAQDASVDYIKRHMKNPESFKVLSVETNLDTIPPYLSDKVIEAYAQFQKANREADDFIPTFSVYDMRKKSELYGIAVEKGETLQKIIKDSQNLRADIQYLTCIKYNAANAIGGSNSSYSIVVAAKEKPDSVLGSYDIENDDFMALFKALSHEFHGKDRFKENKYGKIDTIGFSYFEKFIISATQ